MRQKADFTQLGFDLNATRVRAAAGLPPRVVLLDGGTADMPLALSLEHRQIEVGRAGFALCRCLPHLVCTDFLGNLGKPRVWEAGRHSLDAAQALGHVFRQLNPLVEKAEAVVVATPPYLTRPQTVQLQQLATQARWPIFGTVTSPLAAALAAYQQQAWSGPAVIVDIDDHALTWTLVHPDEGRLHVMGKETCPHLSLRAWKERLLDAIADRCIRRSRRDPRESGAAEQALYEQLDGVMHACQQQRLADLTIQAGPWYQDLVLKPEEVVGFSARLVTTALAALGELLDQEPRQPPAVVVLTAAAGALPGLALALHERFAQPEAVESDSEPSDDFGENLIPAHRGETTVLVLPEDAVSRVACELASAFQQGQLPQGHLDTAIPLPRAGRVSTPSRRFGTRA